MAQIAYLIVLTYNGATECWDYQTHDGIGTVVNFGSGYADPALAIKQAHIFTRSRIAEQIVGSTVIIPFPDDSSKDGVKNYGKNTEESGTSQGETGPQASPRE